MNHPTDTFTKMFTDAYFRREAAIERGDTSAEIRATEDINRIIYTRDLARRRKYRKGVK